MLLVGRIRQTGVYGVKLGPHGGGVKPPRAILREPLSRVLVKGAQDSVECLT